MISQILEFLSRFFGYFLPFSVVQPWSAAVIIRLGKVVGVAGPGLVWHMPMGITIVADTAVVTQTLRAPTQTVTTKCGASVVAGLVLKFRIIDVKTFLVDIFDAKSAIDDVAAGALRLLVKDHTWAELQDIDLDNELSIAIRRELKKFGIHLEQATLADFGRIKSLRLMLDKPDLVVEGSEP